MRCPCYWPGYDVPSLVAKIFKQQMHQFHAKAMALGLQRGQPAILLSLAQQEGITQSELAAAVTIRPASVTHSLQRLEQAGLVERIDDPHDQRITRVHLSPQGREVIRPLQETMKALSTRALDGFDETEIATLSSYLDRIAENLCRDKEIRSSP